MPFRLYQFGNTVLPDYNEESDIGRAVTAKAALDIPSGGALDLFAGGRILPGARTLTKVCTLHSTTESGLNDAYRELARLVGTREKLYRMNISDGGMLWAWARLDKLAATRKYGQLSLYLQDATLSFTIFSVAWYSLTEAEYRLNFATWEDDDLTTCLVEGDYSILPVVLGGNLNQPNVVFEFTATSLITHIEVVNSTNGYIWVYEGTVHSGDILIVDCGEMSVTNDGVDDYANFFPPDNKERWFELEVNENRILIGADGDANIYIHYYGVVA